MEWHYQEALLLGAETGKGLDAVMAVLCCSWVQTEWIETLVSWNCIHGHLEIPKTKSNYDYFTDKWGFVKRIPTAYAVTTELFCMPAFNNNNSTVQCIWINPQYQ